MKVKDEQKRTLILAAAAGLIIVLFVVDSLMGPGDEDGAAKTKTAERKDGDAPLIPVGAPPDADRDALMARYRPILDVRPFERRSFRPKPKAPKRRPRRRDDKPAPRPKSPTDFNVRLTGVVGDGDDRTAVLEERTSGKGLFARKGFKLGDGEVTSVEAASLVLLMGDKRQVVELGDSFTLPLKMLEKLEKLGGKSAPPSKKRYNPKEKPAEITADKRKAILERLKARRAASLKKKNKKGSK